MRTMTRGPFSIFAGNRLRARSVTPRVNARKRGVILARFDNSRSAKLGIDRGYRLLSRRLSLAI
jgi:hypothetical protein